MSLNKSVRKSLSLKKSSLKKSLKINKTPSKSYSLRKMSLTKEGKVKNSPMKSMNGLSLKKLIQNDQKMDPSLREELQKINMIIEDTKSNNYSNEKMKEKEFCAYLKTNVNREKMKKLFDVLLLKHKYSEKKSLTELCYDLRIHRPDLMRPRILNTLLAIINVIFNKTAIIIFLLMTGIAFNLSFKYLQNSDKFNQLKDVFTNQFEIGPGKILNDNIEKLQQQINSLDPESEKISFLKSNLENLIKDRDNQFSNFLKTSISGAHLGVGVLSGAASMTMYNILRQASYFMPKGFRMGNRIRARHSARKIIGDTRKNHVVENVNSPKTH